MTLKATASLTLGFVVTLTACDRIQDFRNEVTHWQWQRRERAFHTDMDQIAQDTKGVYRLDYALSDSWLSSLLDTRHKFRAIQGGRFDMSPWLQDNGVEASLTASAIFDPAKREIVVINTGPNIAVIVEGIIAPLRPHRYRLISPAP